jgi:hypothetical protein
MAGCDYCGETFDEEDALLVHMRDEHEGELGRIDRRRVSDLDDGASEVPTGPLAIAFIIFVSAAVVAFVVFGGGGNGSSGNGSIPTPERTPTGSVHEHGTMEMVVLGDQVDFSELKYQVSSTGNPNFHFENGNGRVWHAHAEGITIQYALWTLDIGVPAPDTVIFDGTTYSDGDEYNVSVTANGEPVDPTTYTLEGAGAQNPDQGDHVRIVVERVNESG